jgi:transposase
MSRGQKTAVPVQLDAHDRTALTRRLRRCVLLRRRLHALLLLGEGMAYAAVARQVHMSERHVRKWACRYRQEGLAGLHDHHRRQRQ